MKINHDSVELTPHDVKETLQIFAGVFKREKIPKNKKEKIGIVIALKTENDKEKIRLENDLVSQIHGYLSTSGLADLFYIIQFPQSVSKKIIDHKIGLKYLVLAKAHFMIYGDLFERNVENVASYLFRLHGMVRHIPIIKDTQNVLANDFSMLLPSKITFPESKEVLGFEITQQWLGYVIKYIVGFAALVSNDLDLAHNLFTELRKEVDLIKEVSRIPVIGQLRSLVLVRLVQTLEILLMRNYHFYSVKNDKKFIFATKPLLDSLKELSPSNYQAHLLRAMYSFMKGDVESAIHEFDNIKEGDPTWRYSLGFLFAYQGKIDLALNQYQKTFYSASQPNVVNDVDIFISRVISENPTLMQLYFFRGLVNYKAKPDYELAKEDFEAFLEGGGELQYPKLAELSKKYLAEIATALAASNK